MNKRKYRPFVLSLLFLTNNSETILCSAFTRFNTHHPKLVQAAERHYCCQAGQLPGRAAAGRLRTEPLYKVAHFVLRSGKCCAVSGSKQQTLSVTSYVCTS